MDKTLISILAGLGGMFGWGTSDFFANLSSDKIGHLKTFLWSQLAGLMFVVLLIPFFRINIDMSFSMFFIVLFSSLFYAAGYLLFYKAFEIGNVSIVATTVNLNVVLAMIIAVIFKGQSLTSFQFFAVALVMIGVTLVAINFEDLKNKKIMISAGIKEVLFASVFFAVFWNLSEYISEQIGWFPTTLYIKIGAILSLLLFSLFTHKKIHLGKVSNKIKLIVVLIGLLESVAVASVNYGLEFGDLILVSPISSALSIVTIFMAVIFLKEKISKIQFVGIATTIVGIILTAL